MISDIPNPETFATQYGPYAFGVIAFLIILAAVVAAIVRPVMKMRDEDRKERTSDLERIEEITRANAAISSNLSSVTDSLSKMNEDQKVIAKLQEAAMGRGERMLATLERLTQRQ